MRDGRISTPARAFDWPIFATALKEGVWAIMMPVIVFGGIYGGVFSPTEAAGVACVYAIFVTMVVHREIGWGEFWDVSVNSMYLTAQIFLIVAVAGVFSWLLTTSGVATGAVGYIAHLQLSPWMVLLTINVFLLIVGCFIDTASAILVLTPLLLPMALAIGVDPDPFRHHRRDQPEHRHVHAAVRHQHLRGAIDLRRAAAQHLCRRGAVHRRCHRRADDRDLRAMAVALAGPLID